LTGTVAGAFRPAHKKKGRSELRPEFREETPKKCVTTAASLHVAMHNLSGSPDKSRGK
jgi:hypothetical protein